MAVRERFRDSAGVLADYIWQVNHREEEASQDSLNMERTAVTTGVGFVRQQGAPSPRVLNFSGTILHQEQVTAFDAYYAACQTRTIFFRDVSGVEMEVIIIGMNVTRKAVLRNPHEPEQPWIWKYQIQMEVIA